MKKYFLRFSIVIFSFFSVIANANAQIGPYAITNARIVMVSGADLANGTIVIRDGLIESVGTNVKVPADAKVFDGKGLTVYPGLIDANTNLAIKKKQPSRGQSSQQGDDESNSNYPAGLRPEKNVADNIKAGEDQFKAYRNSGFTTALTVSPDGIWGGHSAVINLAGDSVSSMIVKTPIAQHFTFRTERRGVFPTSLMGTFAAFRQMLHDAKRLAEIKKMYAENPLGMRRPESDPSLKALIPLLNREIPIVFNANTEREIIRALGLAKEFNLRAVIAGGQESWKVADRLKAANVPVLLSMNFPIRTLKEHKEAEPEPLNTLRLRAEVPKNAVRLKQAGVKFAFESGGLKNIADFLKNAAEATKNGLSERDAIRAMTINSAEILGVDKQLGTIEKGKIANLIVAKGDLFSDKREITYVFVDGKLFKPEKKPEKKDQDKTAVGNFAQVGGTWDLTIEPPGQSFAATLVLAQQGSSLTGTLSSPTFAGVPIRNGKATADGFTFEATVLFQGQNIDVVFSGKVSGDRVDGSVDTDMGAAVFSGTRTP